MKNYRMKNQSLEQRLSRVEREVRELKAALSGKSPSPWWREIIGVFKNDPAFAEIVRLGRQIRHGKGKRAV